MIHFDIGGKPSIQFSLTPARVSSAHPFQYVQPDEPIDAPEFSLWVDTDEEALYIARAEGVGF